MTREETILSLAGQVHYLAGRFHAKMGLGCGIALTELQAAAWLGAIDAVDRFDPSRGFRLVTFAERRIRGAMQDYLRSLDHLSRLHRYRVSKELAPPVVRFSIDDVHPGDVQWEYPCERAHRDHRALEARLDVAALLAKAGLRKRTREIIMRRYFDEEPQFAIAASLGIHESRVAQIIRSGLNRLRAAA